MLPDSFSLMSDVFKCGSLKITFANDDKEQIFQRFPVFLRRKRQMLNNTYLN